MTEFSKEVKVGGPSTLAKTERNRFVSWESDVQIANQPGIEALTPKASKALSSLTPVSRIAKSIFAVLVKVIYSLFKVGYEVAKFFTRRLSSIRGFLFSGKKT